MTYTALYRTYRPQKFKDVVGQEVIVKTLQNAIATNKTTHAYLFSGPRGTGKTTIARIFAKTLNCTGRTTNEPCCECDSCKAIANSSDPDVIEIDAASNNGVDEIRDIRDKVKFMPGNSRRKIYIIDEVHMLTQGAFNALLKTLEEPPEHVIFILATTEPNKVLPTIISRCQRYDFKSLSVREISNRIKLIAKDQNIMITDEAVNALAESAEGGMRDALSYLDQTISFSDDEVTVDDVNTVTGNLNYDKIIELAENFQDQEIEKALINVNDLVNSGKEISKIVSSLLNFYRDILLYKNTDISAFSKYIFEKENFRKLANEITQDKIFYFVDVLGDIQNKIKYSSTPYIFLEIALIKMIKVGEDDLKFMKKVDELEEKIKLLQESIPTIVETLELKPQAIDDTKINELDEKITRIAAELSKLELPRMVAKIEEMESKNYNSPFIDNSEDVKLLKEQVESIIESVQLMKVSYGNLMNQVNNFQPTTGETLDTRKITELEERITVLENNNREFVASSTPSLGGVEDLINRKLQVVFRLKEEIDSLKQENIDKEELLRRIRNIEERLTAISSMPTPKTEEKKEPEKKEKYEQIVLLGDDIAPINDTTKPYTPNVDFGNIQKEETINEIEEVSHEEKPIVEKPKVEETPKIVEEPITTVAPKPEAITEEKIVREINNPEAKIIIEETPTSQLVRTERETKVDISEARIDVNRYHKEEIRTEPKPIAETKPVVLSTDVPPGEYKPRSDEEYSAYRVSIVERILNDARTISARNDKARIINLWKNLDKNVPVSKLSVAEMLQEGEVVAVGNKEIILIYGNVTICNQVMRLKFKNEALRLLYTLLGDTYNYIALPQNVWLEKRTEYVNAYNAGVTPRLSEINCPGLNVERENKEYAENEQDMLENKAYDIFGSSTIKFK